MDSALLGLILGWVFCIIWVPLILSANKKTHPKALFVLFFAEMWERFSFYGMRALLTLFMAGELFRHLGEQKADVKALAIYGSYTAMVYLFPVLGGLVADKFWGFRRAIFTGGALMALGHFLLALLGVVDETNTTMFYLALAFIIMGNGYFKPNVSSFLGEFYEKADVRKDSAYNIFYMGVNVGSFLAMLTCGYVGETINWHLGFGIAGAGMVLGLVVFYLNRDKLENKGRSPNLSFNNDGNFIVSTNNAILLGSLLFIPLIAFLLNYGELFEVVLLIVGTLILSYLLFLGVKSIIEGRKAEGQKLIVILVLGFFNILFWALFEQAGGSLTLFVKNNVNRVFLGNEVPASIFQSFNPLFIILLAPFFAWLWRKLAVKKRGPSTPMKFVWAFLFLMIGYGIIVLGSRYFETDGKIAIVFIILMYLFHTIGELCISPIGLSMVSKMSPVKIVGFVMGTWFVTFALGYKLAGKIGEWTAGQELPEKASLTDKLNVYSSTYLTWGVFVILGAALILLLIVPTIKRWMNEA